VLDQPAPGTAFIAAEGRSISVWCYLYGDDGGEIAGGERERERWQSWLDDHTATG